MTGDHDHDWEEDKKLVERFEDSLKSNMDLYFEEEELEDIIRFYFDQQKFLKALRASEYALEKFPFSVEIRLQKPSALFLTMSWMRDWRFWNSSTTFPRITRTLYWP
jgi:hypothetical protein